MFVVSFEESPSEIPIETRAPKFFQRNGILLL